MEIGAAEILGFQLDAELRAGPLGKRAGAVILGQKFAQVAVHLFEQRTPAVEAQIRERTEGLERNCDRLTSCRVIVEGRHRAQRPAQQFHLRVELTLPGKIITVGRHPASASVIRQSIHDTYLP